MKPLTEHGAASESRKNILSQKPMIPDDLKAADHWCVWRYEERGGKPSKVPYNARTDRRASTTNPADWCEYPTADMKYILSDYSGVGFLLGEGWAGVDLDNCRDEHGRLSLLARKIVEILNSYTEVSPSGRGIKIFVKGALPQGAWSKNTDLKIEMYGRGYFTVTGNHLAGTPDTVEERTGVLAEFQNRFKPECSTHSLDDVKLEYGTSILTDNEVLAKARAAANSEKFKALFDEGDLSGHSNDHSSADLALLTMLAFWCRRDVEQMERLFGESALAREKWHGREDYRQRTIKKAAAGCAEVYGSTGDPSVDFSQVNVDPQGVGSHNTLIIPKMYDAADLLKMTLPKTTWVVRGLMPAGLIVLGGKPKVGKSWFALQLGLAIARGETFLGFSTGGGQVLYLALEDSAQRVQSRLKRVLNGEPCPMGLTICLEWGRFDPETGLAALDKYLAEHPDCKLVIVDVLTKVRPLGKANKELNAYERDYQIASALKKVADKHGVCALGITHLRKSDGRGSGGDVFERVTGSTGFPAAADVLMVLDRTRGVNDAILHATGRDIESVETMLTQDQMTMTWNSLGPNSGKVTTPDRLRILQALKSLGTGSPKKIAETTGLDLQYVKNTLPELLKSGAVSQPKYGQYEMPVSTGADNQGLPDWLS